jgi:hypothetical protein
MTLLAKTASISVKLISLTSKKMILVSVLHNILCSTQRQEIVMSQSAKDKAFGIKNCLNAHQ